MTSSSSSIPFEGVEKRLVVTVKGELPRNIDWTVILERSQCRILSSIVNRDDCQIYLLSESTLVVWKNGFLLKTCGRTTPFLALEALLESIEIVWIVYTRLEFIHPEFQQYPHSNFTEEREFFTTHLFENNHALKMPFRERPVYVITYGAQEYDLPTFVSEEYLLVDIFEDCVQRFSSRNPDTPGPIQMSIPRRELLDEFWFEPVGYSCNALLAENEYFDCHISPEPITSYASLEKGSLNTIQPPGSLDVTKHFGQFAPDHIHTIYTAVNTASPKPLESPPKDYKLVHEQYATCGPAMLVYLVYSLDHDTFSDHTTTYAASTPSDRSSDTDDDEQRNNKNKS